jgi:hypothetical protein
MVMQITTRQKITAVAKFQVKIWSGIVPLPKLFVPANPVSALYASIREYLQVLCHVYLAAFELIVRDHRGLVLVASGQHLLGQSFVASIYVLQVHCAIPDKTVVFVTLVHAVGKTVHFQMLGQEMLPAKKLWVYIPHSHRTYSLCDR